MLPVCVFLEQKNGNPYLKFSQYLTMASKPLSAAFFLIFRASVFFYNILSPLNHSNNILYEIKEQNKKSKNKPRNFPWSLLSSSLMIFHASFKAHKQTTVCVFNKGTDCKFGVFLVDEECHCVHFSLGIIQSTK